MATLQSSRPHAQATTADHRINEPVGHPIDAHLLQNQIENQSVRTSARTVERCGTKRGESQSERVFHVLFHDRAIRSEAPVDEAGDLLADIWVFPSTPRCRRSRRASNDLAFNVTQTRRWGCRQRPHATTRIRCHQHCMLQGTHLESYQWFSLVLDLQERRMCDGIAPTPVLPYATRQGGGW